jgi:hypothetical protein
MMMLGRLIRDAPPAARVRVARALPEEWGTLLYEEGSGARDLLGHLEDWRPVEAGFGIEPGDALLPGRERARARYLALVDRFGLAPVVEALRAAAKKALAY